MKVLIDKIFASIALLAEAKENKKQILLVTKVLFYYCRGKIYEC